MDSRPGAPGWSATSAYIRSIFKDIGKAVCPASSRHPYIQTADRRRDNLIPALDLERAEQYKRAVV